MFEVYIDKYDFFVKVDDDSFFVPENFRLLVKDLDANEKVSWRIVCILNMYCDCIG